MPETPSTRGGHEAPQNGDLFRAALRKARGTRSKRSVAAEAGMTEGRWRQIEDGWMSAGGTRVPVPVPPAGTVIRMANALTMDHNKALYLAGYDAAAFAKAITAASPDDKPVGRNMQDAVADAVAGLDEADVARVLGYIDSIKETKGDA